MAMARPGGGKNFYPPQAVAASENQKWGIFTLEMEAEAIVARLAANVRSIALNRLYRGSLTPPEWQSWKELSEDFKERKIWLEDRQTTVEQLGNVCTALQRSHGLDAIVVDYLQLVTP